MQKILFVDDESKVLEGLQRTLRPIRHEWDVSFADGGPAALEVLKIQPFDLVVPDMGLPGLAGAQLLQVVKELYPQVVHIVLSGHSDQDMILNSLGVAHQFLSNPCPEAAPHLTRNI